MGVPAGWLNSRIWLAWMREGKSRWRDQRLEEDRERRLLMAIFALTKYARFLARI